MQNGQMEVGIEEPAEMVHRRQIEAGDDVIPVDGQGRVATARGTVTRNPRIVAISRISNILDGLDEDSRGRAVRFIAEEYAEFLSD